MQDQETPFVHTLVLFERTVILLMAISFTIGLLYLAGSYQDFGARTQWQLLFVLQASSGIGAVGAVFSFVGEIVVTLRTGIVRRLRRVFGILLIGILLGGIAAITTALLVFLEGSG